MKKNLFYNESLKIINDFYVRLKKINSLPNIKLFKKKINSKYIFYYQDNNKKQNLKIIKKEEFENLQKKIKEREKLIKINNKAKIKLQKNIKILDIIDKNLSNSIKNQLFAYNLDAIPISERSNIVTIIVKTERSPFSFLHENISNLSISEKIFKDVFSDWVHGKIKAKDIPVFINKKILN
ncbi:MAG: hypothetical protein J6Y70_01055 [Bacilli bacterium]|nr:hypothetical protein [Bacilli bacterium]